MVEPSVELVGFVVEEVVERVSVEEAVEVVVEGVALEVVGFVVAGVVVVGYVVDLLVVVVAVVEVALLDFVADFEMGFVVHFVEADFENLGVGLVVVVQAVESVVDFAEQVAVVADAVDKIEQEGSHYFAVFAVGNSDLKPDFENAVDIVVGVVVAVVAVGVVATLVVVVDVDLDIVVAAGVAAFVDFGKLEVGCSFE